MRLIQIALTLALVACGSKDNPDVDSGDSGAASVDADGDGFTADNDCNDNDATVNPDAEETLDDDVDNNCDGIMTNSATRLMTFAANNNYGGYAVTVCEEGDGQGILSDMGNDTIWGFTSDVNPSGEDLQVVPEVDSYTYIMGRSGTFTGIFTHCEDSDGGEKLLIGADYESSWANNGGSAWMVDGDVVATGGDIEIPGDEQAAVYSRTEDAYLGGPNGVGDVTDDGCDDWYGTSTGMAILWVLEGDCSGGWSGYFEVETQMDLTIALCTEEGPSGFCGIAVAQTESLLGYNDPYSNSGFVGFFQLPLTSDSTEIITHSYSGETAGDTIRFTSDGRHFYLGDTHNNEVLVFDGSTGEETARITGPRDSSFGYGLGSCTSAAGDELLVIGANQWNNGREATGRVYVFNQTLLGGLPTDESQASWIADTLTLLHLGYSVDCGVVDRGTMLVAGAWAPPSSRDSGAVVYLLE